MCFGTWTSLAGFWIENIGVYKTSPIAIEWLNVELFMWFHASSYLFAFNPRSCGRMLPPKENHLQNLTLPQVHTVVVLTVLFIYWVKNSQTWSPWTGTMAAWKGLNYLSLPAQTPFPHTPNCYKAPFCVNPHFLIEMFLQTTLHLSSLLCVSTFCVSTLIRESPSPTS